MTTKVYLDGAMGDKFGNEFDFHVSSPAEALRMIQANFPDFVFWMRDNIKNIDGYRVSCEYESGMKDEIGKEELFINGKIKSIRFSPVIAGSGNTVKIIVGAVLIVAAIALSYGAAAGVVGAAGAGAAGGAGTAAGVGVAETAAVLASSSLYSGMAVVGAGLMLSGIAGAISPTVKSGTVQNRTSAYFNGPQNTSAQGAPVPLIYGRCLVGSQVVDSTITIVNPLQGSTFVMPPNIGNFLNTAQ